MEVLLLLIMGICNIVCFITGAKIGQSVTRGEKIEIPTIDPLKPIREREDRKQAKAEQERIETIMRNIESYDGTSLGQEEVP